MSTAKRKRKGSSKAGRPKKAGARYACGKLKPSGPNATTVERRKAGDASAGEHPMDFALSQQWITERQHRDAMAYRAAFNRAHIGGPRLSLGGLVETPPAEELRMKWAEMSDADIAEIFDKVFSGEPGPEDREVLEAAALERWKRLNIALHPQEREELFLVCVLGSWPFWMPKKAADHALGAKDTLKEQRLRDALGALSRALRPAKPAAAVIAPAPFVRVRKGRAELDVRYETTDGQEVQPESERGVPFAVTILRKRA
jgi:hypothetical protein